ncbi:hypothetical protein O3802_06405 [Gemella sp. 27098_8_92]
MATYVFVIVARGAPFSSTNSALTVTLSPLFALSKNLNGKGNAS